MAGASVVAAAIQPTFPSDGVCVPSITLITLSAVFPQSCSVKVLAPAVRWAVSCRPGTEGKGVKSQVSSPMVSGWSPDVLLCPRGPAALFWCCHRKDKFVLIYVSPWGCWQVILQNWDIVPGICMCWLEHMDRASRGCWSLSRSLKR